MRNIVYMLLLALIFGGCGGTYTSYVTKAKEHQELFEEFVTDPRIITYRDQLRTDKLGAKVQTTAGNSIDVMKDLEDKFKECFFGMDVPRLKGQHAYRVKRALEILSEQRHAFKGTSGDDSLLNHALDPKTIWIREVDLPFADYDHVKSPYRNKSLVYYHFDKYNPKTGFGVYYQTNAFYLRDAYDLSLSDLTTHKPGDSTRVEFFCAPFFVQKTSAGIQLHLLSPANELIERKVFELIERKPGEKNEDECELFKKYEYKLNNDFPFNLTSYKLRHCTNFDQYRVEKMKELHDTYNSATSNKQATEFNELSPEALKNIDFMYPVKMDSIQPHKPGQKKSAVAEGWVYFGKIYINRSRHGATPNDTMPDITLKKLQQNLINAATINPYRKKYLDLHGSKDTSFHKKHLAAISIKDETFYKKSPFLGLYYFNNEIENLERLKIKRRIQPLEVIYLRKGPGKDMEIIGEASPHVRYEVTAMKLNDNDYLWLKVKDVGHERDCPECRFNCKKNYKKDRKGHKKGDAKKFRKKCQGTCACHLNHLTDIKKKFKPGSLSCSQKRQAKKEKKRMEKKQKKS